MRMFTGRFRMARLLMLSVFVMALAAACTASADTESLVVYSGRGESLVQPVIDQFETATGIEVEVKYGGTGEMAATLLEEGSNTPADVFFAQDPGGLGAVEDMLAPLPQDILASVPEWARSPEGKWVGTSGRARVVVYNTDSLTEEDLPDSIWDFVNPEWNGRIGWAPSNGSFHAMVTGMRVLWGEEKTREWLEGIVANEPGVYPNNTSVVQAAADGEVEVGFVNHYYLHRFIAEEGPGFKARNYYPRATDPGSVVLVAGAGVLEESDNKETAERFLKFLLSVPGQQYFASQTFEFPLNDGAVPNDLLPPMDSLNNPEVDISDLGDLERTQDLLREVNALP